LSGVNKKTIKRVEKSENINIGSLKAIASVYEIDFNDLYVSERKRL